MGVIRAIAGWLMDASTLLAFAGVLAVAGLAGGYINVQQKAERELALRQGAPAPVAIEAFIPGVNTGPAREVRVRAATNLDDPLILTLPDTGETAIALPLFPLTGPRTAALGVILIDVRAADAPPVPADLVTVTASGAGGTEVEVGGFAGRGGDFELMVAGALSADGLRLAGSALTVRPFLNGRAAALQVPETPPTWWLWCLSLASIVVAFAGYRGLWAAPRALERTRLYAEERARTDRSLSRPVVSSRFDPLPSQEEVNGVDDWEEREPSRLAKALFSMAAALRHAVQTAVAFVLRPLIERLSDLRSPR